MRHVDALVWHLRKNGWIRTGRTAGFFWELPHGITCARPRTLRGILAELRDAWRRDDWGKQEWDAFFAALPPQRRSLGRMLRDAAAAGMREKNLVGNAAAEARLEQELRDVVRLGEEATFLWAFGVAEFLREESIPRGPGRGAVCGSLLAYVLGITRVNPLAHGLLWERFLAQRSLRALHGGIQFDLSDLCWDQIESRYGGEGIELRKLGFLFLRAPHEIHRAFELLRDAGVDCPCPDQLPLDDPKVYDMLSSGHCQNVFQLHGWDAEYHEPPIVRDLLRTLQPRNFRELVAFLSLFRPPALKAGLIDAYIAAKHSGGIHHQSLVLNEALAETYGVLIYQEQAMQIVHRLAGLPHLDAYRWIRALSLCPREAAAIFLQGCRKLRCATDVAASALALLQANGPCAYNKAHAVAYGIMTCQTAWLEVHHPDVEKSAREEVGTEGVHHERADG